jgi:hypothetical protein
LEEVERVREEGHGGPPRVRALAARLLRVRFTTLVLAVLLTMLTALLLAHAGLVLRLALRQVLVQLDRLAHFLVVLAPAAHALLIGLRRLLLVDVLVAHRVLPLGATPARRRQGKTQQWSYR